MSLTHGSTLITGRIRFCSGQLFRDAISRNIKDFEVFKFPGKIQDNFVKWDLFYNLSPRWMEWVAAVKLRSWLPKYLASNFRICLEFSSSEPNWILWLKSIWHDILIAANKASYLYVFLKILFFGDFWIWDVSFYCKQEIRSTIYW